MYLVDGALLQFRIAPVRAGERPKRFLDFTIRNLFLGPTVLATRHDLLGKRLHGRGKGRVPRLLVGGTAREQHYFDALLSTFVADDSGSRMLDAVRLVWGRQCRKFTSDGVDHGLPVDVAGDRAPDKHEVSTGSSGSREAACQFVGGGTDTRVPVIVGDVSEEHGDFQTITCGAHRDHRFLIGYH